MATAQRVTSANGTTGHIIVLAYPVNSLMLVEAAQFEMAELKDRLRDFCSERIGHEQWPADFFAEELQPAQNVDVAPDGGEVEAIAGSNIAVGGITIVQSDNHRNTLLNFQRRGLERGQR